MPVCCVAGARLNSGLAGVGVIFVLAMVAVYENSCTFVLLCNYVRSVDEFQIEKVLVEWLPLRRLCRSLYCTRTALEYEYRIAPWFTVICKALELISA